MQKYLGLLFLVLFSISSCEEKAKNASVMAQKKPAVQKKVVTARSASESISLNLSKTSAKSGGVACISFITSDFTNILGYQHSIQFDPKQLSFIETKNFGLPNLSSGNFGPTKAKDGAITFVWFDMNVRGITKPNNSKIFDMCFNVLAKPGAKCEVRVSDTPTKIEVVGPQKKKLKLLTKPGTINVE